MIRLIDNVTGDGTGDAFRLKTAIGAIQLVGTGTVDIEASLDGVNYSVVPLDLSTGELAQLTAPLGVAAIRIPVVGTDTLWIRGVYSGAADLSVLLSGSAVIEV